MRLAWILAATLAPIFGAAAGMRARASAASACGAGALDRDDFRIAPARTDVILPRGAAVELPLCTARGAAFAAPILVEAELLPDGVTAPPLTIEVTDSSVSLHLVADPHAPVSDPVEVVVVAGGGGQLHTSTVKVHVTGVSDRGRGLPPSDEGKSALAVLR